MTTMVEVFPSLPARSFAELKAKMEKVRGIVAAFQIDVSDGRFVPDASWPLNDSIEDRAQFERIVHGEERLPCAEDMQFEVHFMSHRPETMLADWIRAGAVRALIHVEADHDFAACREVAAGKMELGISLNMDTPLSRIDEYIEHISCVQLMGIATIGIQGQPFDPRVLGRIREVHMRYPDAIIEVDGAVNMTTAPQLIAAGARRLAPGSYVLNSEDPAAAVRALESIPV
jgi:ribulose-phosphate 3-epimerase